MKWTATMVVDALREAFEVTTADLSREEWSMLTEVPLRAPKPGYPDKGASWWYSNERTIDVLLVRNWASGAGFRRIAVEVKVSRSDYRNETDAKRAPAEWSCHRTVYAAPAGVIDPTTLPAGWGLIEVHPTVGQAMQATGQMVGGRSRCTWRRTAKDRVPGCDMDHLVAAVARPGSRAVEHLRRGESDAAVVAGLHAEVARLTGQLARRDEALHREKARLAQARRLLAAADGMSDCADCGQPVKFAGGRSEWVHVNPTHNAPCERIRQDVVVAEREAATGARYARTWAWPVEPVQARRWREEDAKTVDSRYG